MTSDKDTSKQGETKSAPQEIPKLPRATCGRCGLNCPTAIVDPVAGETDTDDSQLHRETWEFAGIDRINPRVEVEVTAVGAQQTALL